MEGTPTDVAQDNRLGIHLRSWVESARIQIVRHLPRRRVA